MLDARSPGDVDVLDFSDFASVHSMAALDAIFPKIKGKIDPPPNYLTTGGKTTSMENFSGE